MTAFCSTGAPGPSPLLRAAFLLECGAFFAAKDTLINHMKLRNKKKWADFVGNPEIYRMKQNRIDSGLERV